MAKRVYIGLGSNLGDREEIIAQAIAQIGKQIGSIAATSSLYTTEPWGYESTHPFCNAVIAVDTELSPDKLLLATQAIEREQGSNIHRDSEGNYIDRTLDLDILDYDGIILETPSLTLPHPRMHLREFVLAPLAEITSEWKHPLLEITASQLLTDLEL